MNVFFVICGKLITPKLNGMILPGVIRKSILELGIFEVEELIEAHEKAELTEAFCSGTAAVISSIKSIIFQEQKILLPEEMGEVAKKLVKEITNILYGRVEHR